MPRPTNYVTTQDLNWPDCPPNPADPQSGLVIHYDSNDQDLANKDHSACIAYWNWCLDFHTDVNGWSYVGYSWMACVHGYVLEGRGLYTAQAAQLGYNSSHYSVTLACGPSDEVTEDQINAVRELRQWLIEVADNSGQTFGHRDFNSTSCPGDKAYQMVQDNVFEQAPGAITEEDDMSGLIGLKKGDSGERVKSLQVIITEAGHGAALGDAGVDGVYGDGTADGLRLCRADAGSRAEPHFGDEVTGWAHGQLLAALAIHKAKSHSGGAESSASLPNEFDATITVKES